MLNLKLETKVDIILVLLVLIVLFHVLFFIKPEWFNLCRLFDIKKCKKETIDNNG